MKRNFIVITVLILSLMFSAYAAEVNLKEDNRNISIISGECKTAENTKLTVSIFASGNSYDALPGSGENSVEILPYVSVIYAGRDGSFTVEWENFKTGEYDLYISGIRGVLDEYPQKIFVTSKMEEKYDAIKNGEKAELEAFFADRSIIREFTGADNFSVKDSKKSASAILSIRGSLKTDENIKDYINLCVLINALSDTPNAENLDAVISELLEKGIEFENYSLYKSADNEIKENMAKAFSEGQNLSLAEWKEKLNDETVLSGVLMSATYIDAIGYLNTLDDFAQISDKNAASRAVVGNKYSTVDELIKAVKNAGNSNDESVKSYKGGTGGNRASSGGGITATTSAVKQDNPGTSGSAEKIVFNDVAENHWAFNAINYLHWKEIVTGDEKNSFNPDMYITRAEAAKILCRAFDFELQSNSEKCFEDVQKGAWFFDFVNTLKKADIVKGDENNCFNPESRITREDLAVLIFRILKEKGKQPETLKENFTDNALISDYASEAVGKLAGEGILNGFTDGSFKPHANTTRAETAAVIFRIISQG